MHSIKTKLNGTNRFCFVHVPCICHERENTIVEKHDGKGYKPKLKRQVFDVCDFLVNRQK